MGAVLLSHALFRTIRPLRHTGGVPNAGPAVLLDAVIVVVAIVATDQWGSPYIFVVATVISAAGFAGGIPFGLLTAGGCVSAVAVPYHLFTENASTDLTLQWAGELLLIAILAGFVRRLSVQGSVEVSEYLTRLRGLSQLNSLLLQLHDVAKGLPVSLDLAETLESSSSSIRDLFEADVIAVLLRDGRAWTVAKTSGTRLSGQISDLDLPPLLRTTASALSPRLVAALGAGGPLGLNAESRSGLYVPLRARGELIGLLAVERLGAEQFDPHHVTLMEGFSEQMAIAIDNARWFSRIGTLAAEQERSRIARDLHDRVGQSLALVGFELDRIAKSGSDPGLRPQLVDLQEGVRSVISELRETLYDLRTDVSEDRDLAAAVEDFIGRVEKRSGLQIHFVRRGSTRPPLLVEREAWRIAQEAIANAERHAGASCVTVTWTTGAEGAELTVADDGEGLPPPGARRPDGYGLVGMRERAAAIGAVLTLTSEPGHGTTVRLLVSS